MKAFMSRRTSITGRKGSIKATHTCHRGYLAARRLTNTYGGPCSSEDYYEIDALRMTDGSDLLRKRRVRIGRDIVDG